MEYCMIYKVTYISQNNIHGDTLDILIFNLNIDLFEFLSQISVVNNTQDKILCIIEQCIHFIPILPLYFLK